MLLENVLKKNDIFSAKLDSGEEICGKIVEIGNNTVTFTKPLMITLVQHPGMSQPAVAPVPWVLSVPDEANLKVSLDKFVFITKARNEIVSSYTKATTGLEIPPAGLDLSSIK